MNTNENSAHSFTEGSEMGTLKFSNPVSTEKEETDYRNDAVPYMTMPYLLKENQELKALCREVLTAREQYQFFVNGYANGSASISEANHTSTVEHEAYSKLWNYLKSKAQ